jgi:ABC-type long-subunit fatty acid transport system fused permease/ATPase subunit
MAKQPPFQAPPATESSRIEREPDSTAGLLSRLMGEVSTLFRKEIALAKAEVSEAASEAKAGAISLVAGGAIVFAAILVLLGAIVLLLAERMEPWLAALIVAVVVGLVGFVMIQSGKKKLDPLSFKPERTQDALRKE